MRSLQALSFIIILFLASACSRPNSPYYLDGDKNAFGSDYYMIAERKQDSVTITWLTDDNIVAAEVWSGPTETLPLRIGSGDKFKIIDFGDDYIVVKGPGHHGEFKLRPVSEAKYGRWRNEQIANTLTEQYEDSVRAILQMEVCCTKMIEVYVYSLRSNSVDEMKKTMNPQQFTTEFKRMLDAGLLTARQEEEQKKIDYERILKNEIEIDSAWFNEATKNYKYSLYDQRIVYIALSRHPELYTKTENLTFLDEIGQSTGFLKSEVQEIYCKLKELQSKGLAVSLYKFEHRGDLLCQ